MRIAAFLYAISFTRTFQSTHLPRKKRDTCNIILFSEIPRQSEHFNISQYLINKNKMPPPVPIFSKKMDDKQVIYFMWPKFTNSRIIQFIIISRYEYLFQIIHN